MEISLHCLDKIDSQLDCLRESIIDGIDQIFLKYAAKFSEIEEHRSPIEQIDEFIINKEVDGQHLHVTNTEAVFQQNIRACYYQQNKYKQSYIITALVISPSSPRETISFRLLQNDQPYITRPAGKKQRRLKHTRFKPRYRSNIG